jgi:D-proline reductase (dithiol) PrdB
MDPIRYVDRLNEHYRAMGNPPYRWSINETAPLHRIRQPLADCTVALLTSGGVSQCSMSAFDPNARNDHRLDAIPSDAPSNDFQVHDHYYDHTDAESDINCIFPLDRIREFSKRGEIGRVAPRLWSGFMGRIYNRTKVMEDSGPAFADELAADHVDILLAAPS